MFCRAVAELPKFVNLELNGNMICEAGVDAIKSVLLGASKVLGGALSLSCVFTTACGVDSVHHAVCVKVLYT